MSRNAIPRFRDLSIKSSHYKDSTARHSIPTFFFNEEDREKYRDPEKECFMCRQANIYVNPIGVQNETKLTGRNPPPLSRAQIEELSKKTFLTKREARLLLLCFFPEVKNVKYFQLHRYHSCCYDPKHLSLCKNHITALQKERENYPNPNHPFHNNGPNQEFDEEDEGASHRVSFVRIRIEPHKGIPTRFLGPAALPESLVNMLIKQVNHFEDKKKPPFFESAFERAPMSSVTVRRVEPVYTSSETTGLSDYLAALPPTDDSDSDDTDNLMQSQKGNIHGYRGDVMNASRFGYAKHERSNRVNGDLVLEDIEELKEYFAEEKREKRKTRKKHRKKHKTNQHEKPKLNHWELKALEQAQQEPCGCRHHVRRIEADQVVYNWCRCKDHQHKNIRVRPKIEPKVKPIPIEKKSVGLDAMPESTTEVAVTYDENDIDYDVIHEAVYYRTSSGHLVKPEIVQASPANNMKTKIKRSRSFERKNPKFLIETIHEDVESIDSQQNTARSNRKLESSSLVGAETTRNFTRKLIITRKSDDGSMPIFQVSRSVGDLTYDEDSKKDKSKKSLQRDKEDSNDDSEDSEKSEQGKEKQTKKVKDDEEEEDDIETFVLPTHSPSKMLDSRSPIPYSMQKSSKPVYVNSNPTPNFERQSTLVANRRWFDQPLGDQNLREYHSGRYGLIAGTSTEQHKINSEIPDNDYVDPDPYPNREKSDCTIS